MRVTNRLVVESIITNISRNTERLDRAQTTVSTQKLVNKPSDDPVAMGNIMDYRKTISSIDQYKKNIAHAKTHIQLYESALSAINDLLVDARRLASYETPGTSDERKSLAEQVKHIYDNIMHLANTKSEKGYIFSGHNTDSLPFSRDESYEATYHGDDGDIRIIVGEGVEVGINVTGEDALAGHVDVFGILKDLIDAFENPDAEAGLSDITAQIVPLTDAIDQIQRATSSVGSTLARLDTTGNQLAAFRLNLEDMLAGAEDADMATAILELQAQEIAYETCLASAATVLQASLIDFLR
ncbi:MAG: flagellar hook-associated protein FlgL [Thermodesulfobacteriota bacterium]|nr:flagellar hook-associated protein FlgL [Thermodesulfobacteriota bacterium]